MLKDLTLAIEASSAKGVNLALGGATLGLYNTIVKEGMAQKDFSVVYDYLSKKKILEKQEE